MSNYTKSDKDLVDRLLMSSNLEDMFEYKVDVLKNVIHRFNQVNNVYLIPAFSVNCGTGKEFLFVKTIDDRETYLLYTNNTEEAFTIKMGEILDHLFKPTTDLLLRNNNNIIHPLCNKWDSISYGAMDSNGFQTIKTLFHIGSG
jgi:hypothetical protein